MDLDSLRLRLFKRRPSKDNQSDVPISRSMDVSGRKKSLEDDKDQQQVLYRFAGLIFFTVTIPVPRLVLSFLPLSCASQARLSAELFAQPFGNRF